MENKEFSQKLEERTKRFAIDIIRLSSVLPLTSEGKVIKNQITKSGTSVGANYREANRSRSKADFMNKIKICESEANETNYWLEILCELNWVEAEQIETISNECKEILAIFTSVSQTMKQKAL